LAWQPTVAFLGSMFAASAALVTVAVPCGGQKGLGEQVSAGSPLGAGGILVGHGSERTTVADNEISHGGRPFLSAVGVWIGHGSDNREICNRLHDLHCTGVSVGWQWNFSLSKSARNLIEHNGIYDLGHVLLSDLGGIYTLGQSPGTRIRYNVIHDVGARAYGGWGICPDEGSGVIRIESNLAHRCNSGPFFPHLDRELAVGNNVLAFGRQTQVSIGYRTDRLQFPLRRNLVYYKEGSAVGGEWEPVSMEAQRNLYWNASGQPVTFCGRGFAEWQAAGYGKDGLIADPLFVDPEHGDFRLRPGSPAAQIGFEPWDPSDVGPRPLPGRRSR
jgi:hypothetical protein